MLRLSCASIQPQLNGIDLYICDVIVLTLFIPLFGKVKVVAKPLPSEDLLDREAGVAISKRQEKVPASNDKRKNGKTGEPGSEHTLTSEPLASGDMVTGAGGSLLVLDFDFLSRLRVEDELQKSTSNEARRKMSRKIMMQEKLSTHEEEGEVVSGPGKEEEASRVIEARAGTCETHISDWKERKGSKYSRRSSASMPRRRETWSAPMMPAYTASRLLASHQPMGLPRK